MARTEDSALWGAAQEALERYFLARDRGEQTDVLTVCNGDQQLASCLQQMLQLGPAVVVDMPLGGEAPPTTFGDFEILRHLGRGGMGTVYLARQKSLGRRVALKVLDRDALSLPAARLRMRREAELTAHLDHPSIVPVYAVGEVGQLPFIAMKYLPGPSLAEAARPWPPARAAQLGVALARALDEAHVNGVVHRDVKPANILLDGDTPVLVDFGLARAQSDPTLTQEGKIAGTLRYMAPERLDASAPVLDPRVDIYGLGATLYELLSDRAPFAEDNPTALVRAILSRDPPPLRLRGRDHDLETIILRALAKEPGRRFPTAASMADDLERYLAGQPVRSRRLSPFAKLLRQVQRHRRASAALALTAIAALSLLVVSMVQRARAGADRSRRLEMARVDLDGHRHERARTALGLLAESYPGDVEVATWLARARAEAGLDRLFIVLADRQCNVAPAVADEIAQVVGGSAALRTPALEAALVLATATSRGEAAAGEQFDRLPLDRQRRRAAQAVSAWLTLAPPPWSLPPADADATPDEAVLTGLALRLAGAAPELVLAELDRVPAASRSPRVLFLEAVARSDQGQLGSALQLLRGLAGDEAPASVWRQLANVAMQLGRHGEAAAAFARAAADRSPAAEYLRLVHQIGEFERASDRAGRDALIASVRASPERSPEVERLLAEFDGRNDAALVPSALLRLEALLNRPERDPIGKDLTLAAMVDVAAWHLPEPDSGPEDAVRAAHRRFLDDWLPRTGGLRYPAAIAVVHRRLARSLCASGTPGDLLRGLDLYADACAAFPLRCELALDYATAVTSLPEETVALVRLTHGIAARRALDGITSRAHFGEIALPPRWAEHIAYRGWLLAWRCEDFVDMARRAESVRGLLPESLHAAARDAQQVADEALQEQRRR